QSCPDRAAIEVLVGDRAAHQYRSHSLSSSQIRQLLFHCFDKEALLLSIIKLDDFRVRAVSLLIARLAYGAESGFQEQLLDEIVNEQRARIAMPDQLNDELSADALHLFIRNQKVVAVVSLVSLDTFHQVGQTQAKHSAR